LIFYFSPPFPSEFAGRSFFWTTIVEFHNENNKLIVELNNEFVVELQNDFVVEIHFAPAKKKISNEHLQMHFQSAASMWLSLWDGFCVC